MGSTHTWLVGPCEPRIRCMVGNSCLPTYEAIHRHKLLHCFPNFVPGRQRFGDTPDMTGMIAPRALHLNLNQLDSGSPIEEARAGLSKISAAYHAAGAAAQFTFFIEDGVGHVLSPTMWQKTREDTGVLRQARDVLGFAAKSLRLFVGEHAHVRS